MNENKGLIKTKESFFAKFIEKIKNIFAKNNSRVNEEKQPNDMHNVQTKTNNTKSEFLNSIKIQENSGIIYLKMKLENNEIKAIDLTEQQINQLQEIYDEEILKKKNKINKLKGIA